MTSKKNYIISIAILLFLTTSAWADDQAGAAQAPAATTTAPAATVTPASQPQEISCLSGNKQNQQLIKSLDAAKNTSQITKEIIRPYTKPTEGQVCTTCNSSSLTENSTTQSVAEITQAVTAPNNPLPQENSLLFNPDCLKAIVPFQSTSAQYSCGKNGRPQNTKNLCIDESLLTYQNQTLSNLMRCMMATKTPGASDILPTTLLNIYSIETGFKPQYSSNNGVGLGQLTGIFIKDVQTRGQKWTNKILDYAKSNTGNNACTAAQSIIEDKKNPSRSQICNFMSIGSGMERNILYSLLGLTVVLEKSIDPLINSYKNFDKLTTDEKEKLRQITLTESYGHGGPSAARALIRRISKLPHDKVISALNTEQQLMSQDKDGNRKLLNSYLSRIKKRQNNIVKMNYLPADSELAQNFSKEGSRACLSVTK